MMTLDELKKCTDLYSADLSKWPVDLARKAYALTERNESARQYFEKEMLFDASLRQYQPVIGRLDALESRILGGLHAPQVKTRQSLFSRPVFLFAPFGGGLAAAMLVGFIIGMTPPMPHQFDADSMFYSQQQILNEDISMMTEETFLNENE